MPDGVGFRLKVKSMLMYWYIIYFLLLFLV